MASVAPSDVCTIEEREDLKRRFDMSGKTTNTTILCQQYRLEIVIAQPPLLPSGECCTPP